MKNIDELEILINALKEIREPLYHKWYREAEETEDVVIAMIAIAREALKKTGREVMKTIFIVEGSTGAYSDKYSWLVRAFTDEAKAKEFAEMLNCAAKGLFDALDEAGICSYYMNDPENSYIMDRFPDLKKDSRFSMDYTGTSYTVLTCELEG